MTDPYTISAHERGVVRVFTTDLDPEGNAAITPENIGRLLGDGLDLDRTGIEVFPSTNVEAIGLSEYLREGYGIPPEDLEGKASALDALKGLIVLVASRAFKGRDAALDPKDGIRFVGAFREPEMDPPKPMAHAESTEGALQAPDAAAPPATGAKPGAGLVLAALILAAAILLALVL